MNTNYTKLALALLAAAGLVFTGCAKKEPATTTTDEPMTQQVETQESVSAEKPTTSAVYFAFDKSDLDAASMAVLDAHAAWLNANSDVNITVEGNCDERGSREYNLALGQRRADSVRDYLTSQGVNGSRIDTVSFGEERPVCKGSGEACWAQNRRSDIAAN